MASDKIEETFNNSGVNATLAPMPLIDFKEQKILLNQVNYIDLGHDYGSETMIKSLAELAEKTEKLSEHPNYKVGCVIAGKTASGKTFIISATNDVPHELKSDFPIADTKAYGSGSGTSHAEMRALEISSHLGEEIESMYIVPSKTPCPSCAKIISIFHNSGDSPIIKTIATNGKAVSGYYEVHEPETKSPKAFWDFAKPFIKLILKNGNIPFSFIGDYKTGKHTKPNIRAKNPDKLVGLENAAIKVIKSKYQFHYKDAELMGLAYLSKKDSSLKYEKKAGAVALGRDKDKNHILIALCSALPPGIDSKRDRKKIAKTEEKTKEKKSYRLDAGPLEFAHGYALRNGIKIEKIYVTDTPSAGIILDAFSNGLKEIIVPPGNPDPSRGRNIALNQLVASKKIKRRIAHPDPHAEITFESAFN